jgi:hypothetical protein
LEYRITDTFFDMIATATESLKPAQYHKSQSTKDFDPYPLLLLQVYFERLVLFALLKEDEGNTANTQQHAKRTNKLVAATVNQTINDRLRRFNQGQIRKLYEESTLVQSKSPQQQKDSPPKIQKSAQLAADLNNFKSAITRLCKHAPVAIINLPKLEILKKLHPESLRLGCINSFPVMVSNMRPLPTPLSCVWPYLGQFLE